MADARAQAKSLKSMSTMFMVFGLIFSVLVVLSSFSFLGDEATRAAGVVMFVAGVAGLLLSALLWSLGQAIAAGVKVLADHAADVRQSRKD